MALALDLDGLLATLTGDQLEQVRELAAAEMLQPWTPSPGPQTEAFLTQADVLLYGGQAGGGKTDLLCGTALRSHQRALILRRRGVELDGIETRLEEMIGERKLGRWNGQRREWRMPKRHSIKLGGCNLPEDWRAYAGRPRDLMGFDEAGEFAEEQVSSLLGWLRTTQEYQRCRMILASNPPRGGEGAWLLVWFAPWLNKMHPDPAAPGELRWAIRIGLDHYWCDGPGAVSHHPETGDAFLDDKGLPNPLLPLSYTFIPAALSDNPFLSTDPHYIARLMSLQEPLRSQLLYGDFLSGREDNEWQVIPSAWITLANQRWRNADKAKKRRMLNIGIDIAQGGKNKTVLAPLYIDNYFGELDVHPGETTPKGKEIGLLVLKLRTHKALPVPDISGGWGGGLVTYLEEVHGIHCEGVNSSEGTGGRSDDGVWGFVNSRSEMWWAMREALDPASGFDLCLPPNQRLFAHLCAPTYVTRKDQIYVESKKELIKRLGSSTDEADAVIMAWYRREDAVARLLLQRGRLATTTRPDRDPFDDSEAIPNEQIHATVTDESDPFAF